MKIPHHKGRQPRHARQRWRLIVLLVAATCTGCEHMRPRVAESPSEMELLAEYVKEDIEPPVAMEDAFERLRKDTAELKRRLDDVDTMLSARNAELMQTRAQHERALKEISMMRLELEQWRDSLFALQTRLEKQERERIDVLDELARRVEEIQSDVSARRP